MFRLALYTTFALLLASIARADDATAIDVMISYAAEDPDLPTLFLHQKKLQHRNQMTLLKSIMEETEMNVQFRQFYGLEIAKERYINGLIAENYQRVLFLGYGEEARAFLIAARDGGWAPEFVIPHQFADGILNGDPMNYAGNIMVSTPPSDERPAGVLVSTDAKIVLQKIRVTAAAQEKALLAIKVNGSPMCERYRPVGTRIKKTYCWQSAISRDARRERDQQYMIRMKRSILDKQPKCFGMRQATGAC